MTAMSKKIKLIAVTTGARFLKTVMGITRKCVDLKDRYPHFGWEFHTHDGVTYFSASYRAGEENGHFEFPLHMVEVEENCDYIMDQLDELKWSALFYEREGEE